MKSSEFIDIQEDVNGDTYSQEFVDQLTEAKDGEWTEIDDSNDYIKMIQEGKASWQLGQ